MEWETLGEWGWDGLGAQILVLTATHYCVSLDKAQYGLKFPFIENTCVPGVVVGPRRLRSLPVLDARSR